MAFDFGTNPFDGSTNDPTQPLTGAEVGQSTPTQPTSNAGGSIWGAISGMIPQMLGGTGAAGNMSQMIPALATAANLYKGAGDYMDQAKGLTSTLDPFGSQRGMYQDIMSKAQSNPAAYISSLPSYQAALQLGLGAVNRGAMSRAGTVPHSDDIAYASQLASQTWNNEMNRLGQLSGAQFGPGAMAGLFGNALQTGFLAKNAALQAMLAPFFANKSGTSPTGGGTPTGGGSPTGGGIPSNIFNPNLIGTPGLNNTGGVGLTGDQLNYTGSSDMAGGGDWYLGDNQFQGGDGGVYDYIDQLGA